MWIYVRFTEKEDYYRTGPDGLVKAHLEEASGERCLVVPYQEFSMAALRELAPRAVAMSGFGRHLESRKIEWFYGVADVLKQAELPMLCFCGSHQLIGYCFNDDIRKLTELRDMPMRKLRPGEVWPRVPCPDKSYDLSGYFVASGFLPVRQVKKDPLFAGLPETMIMWSNHYCEVKKLPKEFELLASSPHCRIEAMRHKERPLYGTQFHPEQYAEPFLHGKKLLANFAAIVEDYWKKPH